MAEEAKQDEPKRDKVLYFKIGVKDANSSVVREHTFDASEIEAVFWSDRGIYEMLLPFYKTLKEQGDERANLDEKLRKEYSENLGVEIKSTHVDKELLSTLWDQTDPKTGKKAPYILKFLSCKANKVDQRGV
eukprot:279718_1